jgi:hypothetical protein
VRGDDASGLRDVVVVRRVGRDGRQPHELLEVVPRTVELTSRASCSGDVIARQ